MKYNVHKDSESGFVVNLTIPNNEFVNVKPLSPYFIS